MQFSVSGLFVLFHCGLKQISLLSREQYLCGIWTQQCVMKDAAVFDACFSSAAC